RAAEPSVPGRRGAALRAAEALPPRQAAGGGGPDRHGARARRARCVGACGRVAPRTSRRVLALEIKASAAPDADAARRLPWLRDELAERFVAGVVLHTGPRASARRTADGAADLRAVGVTTHAREPSRPWLRRRWHDADRRSVPASDR